MGEKAYAGFESFVFARCSDACALVREFCEEGQKCVCTSAMERSLFVWAAWVKAEGLLSEATVI